MELPEERVTIEIDMLRVYFEKIEETGLRGSSTVLSSWILFTVKLLLSLMRNFWLKVYFLVSNE
jgi:hypothetical protein